MLRIRRDQVSSGYDLPDAARSWVGGAPAKADWGRSIPPLMTAPGNPSNTVPLSPCRRAHWEISCPLSSHWAHRTARCEAAVQRSGEFHRAERQPAAAQVVPTRSQPEPHRPMARRCLARRPPEGQGVVQGRPRVDIDGGGKHGHGTAAPTLWQCGGTQSRRNHGCHHSRHHRSIRDGSYLIQSNKFQIKMILLHGRILRGFPFGNDIMPARSAAVDLYRVSLPPRHRATVARWRGGKENL